MKIMNFNKILLSVPYVRKYGDLGTSLAGVSLFHPETGHVETVLVSKGQISGVHVNCNSYLPIQTFLCTHRKCMCYVVENSLMLSKQLPIKGDMKMLHFVFRLISRPFPLIGMLANLKVNKSELLSRSIL